MRQLLAQILQEGLFSTLSSQEMRSEGGDKHQPGMAKNAGTWIRSSRISLLRTRLRRKLHEYENSHIRRKSKYEQVASQSVEILNSHPESIGYEM